MLEMELKFLLEDKADRKLRSCPALRELACGAPVRRSLRSIYYDTPDLALRSAGIALRLRKDGRRWVQTVKRGPRKISGGLSTPQEAESVVPRQALDLSLIPDDGLRKLVAKIAGDAGLQPVFETRISRVKRRLELGDAAAEVALDRGEIIAGDRGEPLVELEIELLEGGPEALYDIARRLLRDVPFRFSDRSKAARCYALSQGEPAVAPPEPVFAREARLSAKEPVEAAALGVLRSCLDQIAGNVAACNSVDDPEGPHQLRVGLRRLRSAFLLMKPALVSEEADSLSARAQDLGSAIGALRDLDVLVQETVEPVAESHHDPGFAVLLAALEDRREATRKQVRQTLNSAETRMFLLDLSRFIELRGWLRPEDHGQTRTLAKPVRDLAREALDKRWRAVRKAARGLEELSIEQRHDLRKALKKLRYGVDFFGGLFPRKKVKPFAKNLRRLQDVFGALNDMSTAEHALLGPDAPAKDDPGAQRAAGWIIGARTRDAEVAWLEAREDWDALRRLDRFWE